jgi:hypothetical protein
MVRVVAVLTVFAVVAIALTCVLPRRLVYLPLAAPAAGAEEGVRGGYTVGTQWVCAPTTGST